MRYRTIALAIVGGLAAGVYETAVWSFAPSFVSGLRPIVPVIAMLLLYEQSEAALAFAISAGAVVDLFSVADVRFLLGAYVCIALGLGLMARSVFTNRSLSAAIALCLVGRLAEGVWLIAANLFSGSAWDGGLPVLNASPVWSLFVWDIALTSLAFTFGFLIKRRQPARQNQAPDRTSWYG